jgi:transposase-like protein
MRFRPGARRPAVDQDGVVLDILVQARRDACAARRFSMRLLVGLQHVPRVIVTDKLRSCRISQPELLPDVEDWQSRYLNDRPRFAQWAHFARNLCVVDSGSIIL